MTSSGAASTARTIARAVRPSRKSASRCSPADDGRFRFSRPPRAVGDVVARADAIGHDGLAALGHTIPIVAAAAAAAWRERFVAALGAQHLSPLRRADRLGAGPAGDR